MDLTRRISSYFCKPKVVKEELRKKVVEEEEHFLRNGSELQAALIAFSNGQHDILIRNFTAKELVRATDQSFPERVFVNGDLDMFRVHLQGCQVLIGYFTLRWDGSIRNIVVTSHMSHHKNVLKLIGWCPELDVPACVYEYAQGILLSNLLDHSNDSKLLSWRSRFKIASDIASTVVYLHTTFSTPVIHRDLKPSNVIIDQYGVAKLFDFTLSISLPPGEMSVEDDVVGTFGFVDPEYYRSCFVTQKSDVYSFGVLLLVLLTGKSRIFENHEDEMVHVVEYVKHYADNHQYDELIDPRILEEVRGVGNDSLLLSFVDLALMCTQDNGDERPEMIDVAKQLQQMEKSIRNRLPSISS